MTNTHNHTTLYALSKNGKIKQWSVKVLEHENFSEIVIDHGYADGKIVSSSRKITSGKNLGKANATTHLSQAILEAQSLVTSKKDELYVDNIDDVKNPDEVEIVLPMLAHSYSDRSKYIKYPAFVQPKLDGIRCLVFKTKDGCRAFSRGGKEFKTIKHILDECDTFLRDGEILDGELFTTELTFQEIVEAVKREKSVHVNSSKIKYWVYDKIDTKNYKDRLEELDMRVKGVVFLNPATNIQMTPTMMVTDEEAMFLFHQKVTEEGFEGTMIRNCDGPYLVKHRSNDLQKYKDFMTEEFEIVGGHEGVGLAAGQCIFTCLVPNTDKTFNVKCVGTNFYRQQQLIHLAKYIGKMLTVKFQGYSDDGIPRFPVGITVRDYE